MSEAPLTPAVTVKELTDDGDTRGDAADQLLDRQKRPEWLGVRSKMLKSFPKNIKLWEEYAEIRSNSLSSGKGLPDATLFYKANQAALDDGAEASWKARHNLDTKLVEQQRAFVAAIPHSRPTPSMSAFPVRRWISRGAAEVRK